MKLAITRQAILWGLIPLFITTSQFCLKMTALDMENMAFSLSWLENAASSMWIWAALLSEAVAFVIWMEILAIHDLSKAFPLSAISYILILCMGWFVFNEQILLLQLFGSGLILAGVWFIGTASN
jgi:multidrug transporter EmrE-like cation transporter